MKDGATWPIGGEAVIQWLAHCTSNGSTITSWIPPLFDAYATLVHPGEPDTERDVSVERTHDAALVALLARHTPTQPWWLGYLDTGASDIVFWDVPKVELYDGWEYVLVQAGPEQAVSWRPAGGWTNWKGTELPDLMFPQDRSWLVSTLWDHDWSCLGGSEVLIGEVLGDRILGSHAQRVTTEQDATPRGHVH